MDLDDELANRVAKIYAAVGAAEESNPENLRATMIRTERFVFMDGNFRGGLSQGELENRADTLIYKVAHLRDALKAWAIANGRDENRVKQTLKNSDPLKVITDLCNREKHCGPDGRGGWSGRQPQLRDVSRVMRLSCSGRGAAALQFDGDGKPIISTSGNGSAKAVITGSVVDEHGQFIGELYDLASAAIGDWEKLLQEFGVTA